MVFTQLLYCLQLIDRVVCQTAAGMIHIVSPVDGTVVTSMASLDHHLSTESFNDSPFSSPLKKSSSSFQDSKPAQERLLTDAVYCLPLETLFVLYENDCLVKALTTTNPAKIKEVWNYDKGNFNISPLFLLSNLSVSCYLDCFTALISRKLHVSLAI